MKDIKEAIATLVKASNDFIVKGIQADDVNAIPFEEFSYDIIMALVAIREIDSELFQVIDKDVDGVLYSHAYAHEFELVMARVAEESAAPLTLEQAVQMENNGVCTHEAYALIGENKGLLEHEVNPSGGLVPVRPLALHGIDAEVNVENVNEDDGKPQYVECDEQFSRGLMDQLAKDLDPNDVPF